MQTKIESTTIEINGKDFLLYPLPTIKALKLDKKVVSMLLPVLGGVEEFSLDAEIDLGKIMNALSKSLMELSDNEFIDFIREMCYGVICTIKGQPPIEISDDNDIDAVFRGDILTIYKLLYKIMEYNQFSPFAVVGGGRKIIKTLFSEKEQTKTGQDGNKLEK